MLENLLALPAEYHIVIAAIFGLLVGSFLNVVIYRFPTMLKYQWTSQSYWWLNKEEYTEESPPTLSKPASHCFTCKSQIQAWQNIPVFSYLFLRGKCAECKAPISPRYPLIELLTSAMTAMVIHQFGLSLAGLFGVLLTWVLISLTFIDFDHQLLPDEFVLPILWLGLGLSLWPIFANTSDAIIGAIVGYLCFWLIFQIFKILTGKEGMGHGDFKLLALLGAWFGWQYLPQIVFVSTILGSVVGISMMLVRRAKGDLAIPFGPYIAIAGWVAMMWGDDLNQFYLNYTGL